MESGSLAARIIIQKGRNRAPRVLLADCLAEEGKKKCKLPMQLGAPLLKGILEGPCKTEKIDGLLTWAVFYGVHSGLTGINALCQDTPADVSFRQAD